MSATPSFTTSTAALPTTKLGTSDLEVTKICLGTMTFGQQVDEPLSHTIMSRSLELGVTFFDTAEMYAVPPTADSFGKTETYIGNWFAADKTRREQVVLATKIAGPGRMKWIRGGASSLNAQDMESACNDSLKRLQTDYVDLYQIHWPTRHVPAFGIQYYEPLKNAAREAADTPILEQLQGLARLVKAGKVRHIGLSNETPYGVMEFVRLAEQAGLPRVVSVQNPYCLIHRGVENGLDEVNHRLNVSLLAYSPLGFGLLTGKYDAGIDPATPEVGRMAKYESMRQQRWGRADSLVASRKYNQLARDHGMTPTQMALAFCYTKWQVASTIIGVTSVAQLDDAVAAWGTQLSPEVLAEIDAIRWMHRDPAF